MTMACDNIQLEDDLNIIGRGTQSGISADLQSPFRQHQARDTGTAAGTEQKRRGRFPGSFQMTAPTISHHLAVLKEAGLISDDRRGKYIYYELNTSVLDEIMVWAASLKGENGDAK